MSSIQGLGPSSAAAIIPKPQAVAPKPEARETAQDERAEAARGAQEANEAPSTNPQVGSRLSVTA
ncbi:MAG: hypothetical protein HXX12_12380 [Geothrix sp.]|uniref:hypothetical protein n=1 Tax=Geothrix sp. TaxID=1962974 RepID=UPI00179CEE39|nr:hypothetical protein [Geothrix sp.]NWJ41754.1 hypothetical protein [Geothrix sp.]WIL20267.1 MAG: hypothetical protein QOZ81_002826 [Geothrix sp.]